MIGRTNAGAGIKKLAMAKAATAGARGANFYVTLTCDFDPLVISIKGPDLQSKTGRTQTNWRLTKNGGWNSDETSSYIAVSGRTITAGPFIYDTSYSQNAQILAYGFPD